MFTSLLQSTGTLITSLSKQWQGREQELRKLGQTDALVCPHCKELLTFRSGKIKRAHFSHRQDTKCPLNGYRPPQEIEAKAQLYGALETLWPGGIQMDVILQGETLPIDLLLLKKNSPYSAYWILSRTIRKWDTFIGSATHNQIPHHILYTGDAHKHPHDELILPKQLRDQICHSKEFDSCEFPNLGHLTFINTQTSQLHIYRGLHCVHAPTAYDYELKRNSPLSGIHIHTHGELITKADLEFAEAQTIKLAKAKEESLRKNEERSQRKQAEQIAAKARARHLEESQKLLCIHCNTKTKQYSIQLPKCECVCNSCLPYHNKKTSCSPHTFSDPPAKQAPSSHPHGSEIYTCRYCKKQTSEWSISTPGKQSCVCHACLPQHNQRTQREW